VVEVGDPGDVKAAIGPPKPDPAAAPETNKADCGDEPKPAEAKKNDFSRLLEPPAGAERRPKAAAVPAEAAKDDVPPAEPPVEEPAQEPLVGATDIPGLFEMTVAGLPEHPQIKYSVQLPPEYSPYRRYPCIVTLNGTTTTPRQQIDWWAGDYQPQARTRYGQASRHGYIVIAPHWLREHQRDYEYSAREHAAALYTLRDASRRFSIDSDRVFLSGHSLGGDAAWDIGLAHPDLWAGVLPIVATADKYVQRYWENGKYVPLYFVSGERDGEKLAKNAQDWNRYVGQRGFDAMVVQFQGRGHEHFHEEIQNLFAWMNLHRRNFFPREIDVTSMRPWDSFFWWIDLAGMPGNLTILPTEWPKPGVKAPQITGTVLDTGTGVRVNTPASKTTVWLSPEIVNFDGKVTVTINGRRVLNVAPSLEVLLEDVRTRGDRLHPFWAKAEGP
jgi:predicted esterase